MRERIAGKTGRTARLVAVGASAAVAGCLLAVAVAAHTTHYASSLDLHAYTSGAMDNYVYGTVSSPNSDCVAERKVHVYRKTPGADAKLGADVSNGPVSGVGPYTVTDPSGDLPEGSYYSETRRRDLKPGPHHAHVCRGATSDALAVGP